VKVPQTFIGCADAREHIEPCNEITVRLAVELAEFAGMDPTPQCVASERIVRVHIDEALRRRSQ
jgi:hypothetical protein